MRLLPGPKPSLPYRRVPLPGKSPKVMVKEVVKVKEKIVEKVVENPINEKLERKVQMLQRNNEIINKNYVRMKTEAAKLKKKLERLEELVDAKANEKVRPYIYKNGKLTIELDKVRKEAERYQRTLDEIIKERDRLREKLELLEKQRKESGWVPPKEFTEMEKEIKQGRPNLTDAQVEAMLDLYKRFSTLEID